MNKLLLLLFSILLATITLNAQNTQLPEPGCQNVYAGDDVQMLCTDTDVQLEAIVLTPDYKDTTDYLIDARDLCSPITYDGSRTFIQTDDEWSDFVIDIPFPFCFYDNVYDQILISGNGIVTFDLTVIDSFSNWNINAADQIPTQNWQTNAIFGAYHDMNSNIQSREDRISYKTIGLDSDGDGVPDGPNRKFVINFEALQFSCTTLLSKSQIVLYEGSNVIDVFIEEKPICANWNDGLAVVGIQNKSGTLGVAPAGRNNGAWEPPVGGELWRFVPNGEDLGYTFTWYDEAGNIINTNNEEIVSVSPVNDSATYTAELVYTNQCSGDVITIRDSVTVTPGFTPDTATPQDLALCDSGNGSATFDIDQTTLVLNGLDPADFTISYHTTLDDANNDANPITTDLSSYISTGAVSIFIRIEDVVDITCFNVREFTLTVMPLEDSSFFYDHPLQSCHQIANPLATITGVTGGFFTINNNASINTLTGEIDHNSINFGIVYQITYTTPGFCFTSTTVDFELECFLTIPEGFSPNSSVVENTTFNTVGLKEQYPDFELFIYNRYGVEVFSGSSDQPDWNGKKDNSGEVLPAGTYFYGIKLNDEDEIRFRGWVYLQL
jgi:gliding motility-associated-like protein